MLLAQDDLLGALYPGEFVDLAAFVKVLDPTPRRAHAAPRCVADEGVSVMSATNPGPGSLKGRRCRQMSSERR